MVTETLGALVQRTRLRTIIVVEQHLIRHDWASEALDEARLMSVDWVEPVVEVFTPEVRVPGLLLHVVRAQIQNEGEAVYQLTVAARVTYALTGEEPARELLSQFARDLARHHSWPILRERLMSLALMSGLQPPVLDLNHRPQF